MRKSRKTFLSFHILTIQGRLGEKKTSIQQLNHWVKSVRSQGVFHFPYSRGQSTWYFRS